MSDDWEGRHHDHSTEVDPSWAVAQLVARNYTLAAILTDLIAELRDEHGKRPHPLVGGSDMCQSCGVTFTVNGYCPTWHITDRAEARLKGL